MNGPAKSIRERLEEFYSRLGQAPAAQSAEEALEQIGSTLDAVEDALSGVSKKDPPPPPTTFDGRMYPPLPDFTTRHADGSITARTHGHSIEIGADGRIVIRDVRTGALELDKPGGKA